MKHTTPRTAFESRVIKYDFNWSFRPVFNSLRILGVDLKVSKEPSKVRRCGFLFFWLSVLVFSSFCSTLDGVKLVSDVGGPIPSIQISAALMYSIFFEVVIFAKIFLRWGSIAKKLQLLEHSIRFPATFHNQIRKTLTIFLTIGFISVISSISYISTFDVT